MWSSEQRSPLPGRNVEHARAMAMVVLSCASAAATASLSGLRTLTAWLMTVVTLALCVALVQIPWLAAHLFLRPLHGDDWLIATSGGFLAVVVPLILFGLGRRARRPAPARRDGMVKC